MNPLKAIDDTQAVDNTIRSHVRNHTCLRSVSDDSF